MEKISLGNLMCLLIFAVHFGCVESHADTERIEALPEFKSARGFGEFLETVESGFVNVASLENDFYFVSILYKPGWLVVCDHPRHPELDRLSFTSEILGDAVLPWDERLRNENVTFAVELPAINKDGSKSSKLYYFGTVYPVKFLTVDDLNSISVAFESPLFNSIALNEYIKENVLEEIQKFGASLFHVEIR